MSRACRFLPPTLLSLTVDQFHSMATDYIQDSSIAYERFTSSAGNEFWAPARADGGSRGALAVRSAAYANGLAEGKEPTGAELWAALSGGAELAATDGSVAGAPWRGGRHPILQITGRTHGSGLQHETQLAIFHAMRHYHTTLDTAIRLRRALEGTIIVESDDQGLADSLNDWVKEVRVGYLGGRASLTGLHVYLDQLAEGADEYGLAAGEMLTDERGTEITRLVVPHTRTLYTKKLDAPTETGATYGLYQAQDKAKGNSSGEERIDQSPLVQTCTFTYPAGEGVWPTPMAWSLVQSTEAVLRMHESVANGWWRFGDPSMLFSIQYDDEANPKTVQAGSGESATEVPADLLQLKMSLEEIMRARRQGSTGDAYAYAMGGEISAEVLGQIDNSLMKYFREQSGVFDGHVLAASGLPEWMFPHIAQSGDGLGGQRSSNQAIICALQASKRAAVKKTLAEEVIDMHLVLSGDARYVGRYELGLDVVSIVDDKLIAETDKAMAEAVAQIIENAELLYDPETGEPRFTGDAADYLEQKQVL